MFDRSSLGPIPEQLRSVFLPQLDQLGATPLEVRFGVAAIMDNEVCRGWVWGCAVEPDCLLYMIRVQLLCDLALEEHPEVGGVVLNLMNDEGVSQMNRLWERDHTVSYGFSLPGQAEHDSSESVCAFATRPGSYSFPLKAGDIHTSTCIFMLPSFVERYSNRFPELSALFDGRAFGNDDFSTALELFAALRAISPLQASHAAALPFYQAKVQEALALAAMHILSEHGHVHRNTANSGDSLANAAGSVADHVAQILSTSLDNPPSLDQLASWMFMGKTTLCRRFRSETGMSIGQLLTDMRMREARRLIERGDLSFAEVAARVGYRHQSSFDAAFKRHTGQTPGQCRDAVS